MTQDVLHHLNNTIISADAAWNTASTNGAIQLQHILNTLSTLHAAASPPGAKSPAAPGELADLHSSATSDLHRLRTTLRRLTAIAAGVERWIPELSPGHGRTAAESFASALRVDLSAKTRAVDDAVATIVQPARLESAVVVVARWAEQVDRTDAPDAETVVAIVSAEDELHKRKRSSEAVSQIAPGRPTNNPVRGAESPALALLRQRASR